uniref:Uncharacterized protein n=1 Tax=Serinus canaria TaxID=9135 RepID=A0A8C9MZR1_SERCA
AMASNSQKFREINTENCQAELERKMVIFYCNRGLILSETGEKVNDINIDFNHRFLHFSAKIALDSSYVQELDEILKEARAIEKHLQQKREKLKQRFAVIVNSLQS